MKVPSRNLGLLGLLIAELAAIGAIVPFYLDPVSLLDTTRTFVEPGILALGMTLIVMTGGIDLSVAALLALVSVVIGFAHQAGLSMPLAMLCGVATGLGGGLLNGAAIAYLRLHPFVVTLATMSIFRGAAYAISNAEAVSAFPDWFRAIGQAYLFGDRVPVQLLLYIVPALGCWLLLERAATGRRILGVGANELAARFSGVKVERLKLGLYALMGLLAALAAIIQTARVSTARANASLGLELTVIAMVVLGGTRITGGRGTIAGTLLGTAILAFLQDGLISAGLRSDWSMVVVGVLLIVGVLANEARRRDAR
ncbi:ABC transporter permease [Sphingomonas bacterium]|uniref:ABC transporter permease n=1 Tax=Sphingomonas bacterium TaxID=1895847 RepID=UPI0015756FBE|nr:ABC transporter permease [Sphingomonas bacterium]